MEPLLLAAITFGVFAKFCDFIPIHQRLKACPRVFSIDTMSDHPRGEIVVFYFAKSLIGIIPYGILKPASEKYGSKG